MEVHDAANQEVVSVPTSELINYGTPARYPIEALEAAVRERFTYKAWTPEQVELGKEVTEAFIQAAITVIKNVPPSATRTRVINELEIGRMLANAAITHQGAF